jgi:AraC-like DNA-binding protein
MMDAAYKQRWLAPQCFRTALCRKAPIRPHTHGFHEIVQCAEGSGIQHAGRTRQRVAVGDVLFLPAGMEHVAEPASSKPLVLDVLYFQASSAGETLGHNSVAMAVLRHMQRQAESGQCAVPLTAESRKKVAGIFAELIEEDRDRPVGHMAAMALLLQQLMFVLLRDRNMLPHFEHRFGGESTADRIQRVESFIQTHYMQPLSVEQMASLACLGRSQFHVAFKAATGKTLTAYIQVVRVERAMTLLAAGELPILEVAGRSGFDNLSHFYHVFKAHTGRPPGEFSRRQRQKSSANGS